MSLRILITGGLGVVGARLGAVLRERGNLVVAADLSQSHEDRYVRCDVSEYRQCERVFREQGPFDYVYHTAAEFGRWNGEDYYEQLWKTNAIGTKNIIRLQEALGFKLVVFSSSEVYGDYPELMVETVMDQYAIRQLNDYAISKWVNEMQVLNSAQMKGTETVRVRLFNTYGPGEWYSPYRSVNCRFCYSALMGLPVKVFRGHRRTSTYLDDTVRTLANIVDNFKAGEVFNIGGNQLHTIEELVDIVWKLTGADRSLITYDESEEMTTKVKLVDTTKCETDLKHKNTVSLEEGVAKTIEWMRFAYGLDSSKAPTDAPRRRQSP